VNPSKTGRKGRGAKAACHLLRRLHENNDKSTSGAKGRLHSHASASCLLLWRRDDQLDERLIVGEIRSARDVTKLEKK